MQGMVKHFLWFETRHFPRGQSLKLFWNFLLSHGFHLSGFIQGYFENLFSCSEEIYLQREKVVHTMEYPLEGIHGVDALGTYEWLDIT